MRYRMGMLLLSGLLFSTMANAISAIEFLKAETDNREAEYVKPLVIQFVSRGYKNVPDWPKLSRAIRKKILEKGYTYQSLESVAEEAAIDEGMKR
jgi:hypothetical protein